MPDRLSERLELLASSEGLTKTDVFRRALALYLSLPWAHPVFQDSG